MQKTKETLRAHRVILVEERYHLGSGNGRPWSRRRGRPLPCMVRRRGVGRLAVPMRLTAMAERPRVLSILPAGDGSRQAVVGAIASRVLLAEEALELSEPSAPVGARLRSRTAGRCHARYRWSSIVVVGRLGRLWNGAWRTAASEGCLVAGQGQLRDRRVGLVV